MALLQSYLLTIAVLNWIGIALLVAYDARRRGLRNDWQWGVVGLVTGFFGFALYVLVVVFPPDR